MISKMDDFIEKNRTKLNNLEELFVRDVLHSDYGDDVLDYLQVQHVLERPEGGVWKYDFLLESPSGNKYIIETDGLYSHAEKVLTAEYFDNLQKKQNFAIQKGYRLIRFTNNLVRNETESAIYELRRHLVGDEYFSKLYLKRHSGLQPSPVQEEALIALNETREKGNKKGLVILATGLGKTYLSAFDFKQQKGKTALFIVHIKEILRNSRKSFEEALADRIKEIGDLVDWPEKNIVFATIQSISKNKRLASYKPDDFDYIIFDETHHIAANTYTKVFNHFNPQFFLGLTATPERTDKTDILGFYDNNIVYEFNQAEAVKRGYLVPIKYIGLKDNIDYSGIRFNGFNYDINDLNKLLMIDERDQYVLDTYIKKGKGKKTLGFCVSIEHAERCSNLFNNAGIKSVAIHSNLEDSINEIDSFRKGEYEVAFAVDMFNEGVDVPDIECLLFLRPTSSKTIFTQQLGRGLRTFTNKYKLLVLDFIGNYKTNNKVLQGLGFSSPADINNNFNKTFDENGKPIYVYDLNGYEIEFEEEVVNLFKKIDNTYYDDDIEDEWEDYGNFLKEMSENSNYWKRGNHVSDFRAHYESLKLINKFPEISDDDLKKEVESIIREKYNLDLTINGSRSLILSKVLGLMSPRRPFVIYDNFFEILDNDNSTNEVLIKQTNKFFFWTSLFSKTNKYAHDNKVIATEFSLYPYIFTIQVLSMLEEYGESGLTKFEFDNFVSLSKNHNELSEVTERILNFRSYKKKDELMLYLEECSEKMDNRFYTILKLNGLINFDDDVISLNLNRQKEIKELLDGFKDLMNNEKLIIFDENNPEKYLEMLYSVDDLITYCNKK